MLHVFDSTDKKRIKYHIRSLIHLAISDGHFDDSEKAIIEKLARKFGITAQELDTMIKEDESFDYNPPFELEERFEFLYDLIMMMVADGHIAEQEKKMFKMMALSLNINHKKIDEITDFLIEECHSTEDPDELFRGFKKVLLAR